MPIDLELTPKLSSWRITMKLAPSCPPSERDPSANGVRVRRAGGGAGRRVPHEGAHEGGRRRVKRSAEDRVRKTPSQGPAVGTAPAFYSCIITGIHGPTYIFLADLTPVSLRRQSDRARAGSYATARQ